MLNLQTSYRNLLNARKIKPTKRLYKALLSSALTLGTGTFFIGMSSKPVLADPAPTPDQLPPVFCFRFTDIKAVESDPEGDKFQVEFEVLNWSNKPAGGVRIALNTGTNSFVQDIAPSFAGAGIDGNGRPLGSDADPLPGNQLFVNNGSVVESTNTAIQWDAKQLNFNTFNSGPIPNQNLLGNTVHAAPRVACEQMIPGCEFQGGQGVIPDMETVDNGNNVLDGFVITIDDLDEAEVISWNWNLLDVNGNPIGTPGNGNAYGFGTVNLARIPIGNDPESNFRIFPENTGVGNPTQLFAEDSYKVTEYGPEGLYDEMVDPATNSNAGLVQFASLSSAIGAVAADIAEDGESADSEEQLIALFGAEFGAGITAPFLNPGDNIFNSATNTEPIDYSETPPNQEEVPEPSMVAASMLGAAILRSRRRKKK